jgi:hypothetical protein
MLESPIGRSNGGSIDKRARDVESTKGKGSTVTVNLPVSQDGEGSPN